MNKFITPAIIIVLSIIAGQAVAQSATDTTINTTSIIAAIAPYVASVVSAVILGGLSVLFALLKKKWGLDIDDKVRSTIIQTTQSAVNQQIAKIEGNLGNKSIDLKNPMVVEATNYVIQKLPTELDHFKLSPDDVSKIVQAQFGKIQAGQGPLETIPVMEVKK